MVKQELAAIGVAADLREFDFSTYIQRIYTALEIDITLESLSDVFNPTPGEQRAYGSKNFKIGLPFSNASHYSNPEVDRLLEAAALEPDLERRKQLWFDFQHRIYDNVPAINPLSPTGVTLFDNKVHNHTEGIFGVNGSFADVYIDK